MSMFRSVITGVGLAWVACTALAQNSTASLEAACQLLKGGQAAQAVAALEPDLLHLAGQPDYDYLMGSALFQAGDAGQALFAFERVVMVAPGHVDARLKAARIHLDRGDVDHARELLLPLSTLPPGSIQQLELARLRKELTTATGEGGLVVNGYVALGMGWDDNVTSGPNESELVIPNFGTTPTALGSATRDQDLIGTVEAGVALRQALGENTWLTGNGGISQGFNRTRKDVKDGAAQFDLGLQRRSGSDLLGVALLAQDYLMSDSVYRRSLGVRLSWSHPVDARSRVTGHVQRLQFDFPDHSIDNATRTVYGVTHEGAADGGARLWQYGLYGGDEISKDDIRPHFSYRLWGIHLGTSLPVNDRLLLSAGVVYEAHQHLATDALYWVVRSDAMHSLGLATDYKLNPRWHLISRYTYAHNVSNTALYDYARNTFTLQLRWDFDHATP